MACNTIAQKRGLQGVSLHVLLYGNSQYKNLYNPQNCCGVPHSGGASHIQNQRISGKIVSKSRVSCPGSGSKIRKPNREIAKTRNREIAKKSCVLSRFRIQDPETESGNREIAKSRKRENAKSQIRFKDPETESRNREIAKTRKVRCLAQTPGPGYFSSTSAIFQQYFCCT